MSDIDLAINSSKRLESLLEQKLGASGRGLHEKVSSVEARLPRELARKLRLVATVRNKVVHESDYKKIDDRKAFVKACKEAERELKTLGGGNRRAGRLLLAAVIVVVIAAALIYYAKFVRP